MIGELLGDGVCVSPCLGDGQGSKPGGVDVCEDDTNLAELGTRYRELAEPLECDGEGRGLPRGMQVDGEVLEVGESSEVAKTIELDRRGAILAESEVAKAGMQTGN